MPFNRIKPLFFLPAVFWLIAGCHRQTEPVLPPVPDLVIFTTQEEGVYAPVIKEYQERTGLHIQVNKGTFREMQQQIQETTLAGYCDVVFGIDAAALEYYQDCWEPYTSQSAAALTAGFTSAAARWTPFSVISLVIIYNTRVVTYRELPTDWNNLLEPRFKGRIAFMDPEMSDSWLIALTTAMYASNQPAQYLTAFAANLNYQTFQSPAEVTQAVADGRCSVGVTLEETAEQLLREGADVDYIFPASQSCLRLNGSAVVLGCQNPEAAQAFIDFTVSSDVQHILSGSLNRRPVREDIAPPKGLNPICRLPESTLDPAQTEHITAALTAWQQLFKTLPDERR